MIVFRSGPWEWQRGGVLTSASAWAGTADNGYDHKSMNGMGINVGGWEGKENIISIFFVWTVKRIPNVEHGILGLKCNEKRL